MLAAVMTKARNFLRAPQLKQCSTSILKLRINSSRQGRYPERCEGTLGARRRTASWLFGHARRPGSLWVRGGVYYHRSNLVEVTEEGWGWAQTFWACSTSHGSSR